MPTVMSYLADTSGPYSQLLAAEHMAQSTQAWIDEKKEAIRMLKRRAIDQDIPFDLIYPDLTCLEADIRRFKQLLEGNEFSRRRWREFHMGAWRITARHRKVADLPTEILTMIFAHFEDCATPPEQIGSTPFLEDLPKPDVASIKSIRLTCRAFCQAGSKFLLPVVDVSFTKASVERLKKVSNHPTISKGVRIIRIHADAYVSMLAKNPFAFRQRIATKLRLLPERYAAEATIVERRVTQDCRLVGMIPKPKFLKIRGHEMVLKDAEELLRIVATDMRGDSIPRDRFGTKMTNALQLAHEEYGKRYLEQQSLAKDFRMYAEISSAVRLMQSVQRLCITKARGPRAAKILDGGLGNQLDAQLWRTALKSSNPFLNMAVYTTSMYAVLRGWGGESPSSLAPELPLVLQFGSRNLTRLDIEIPPTGKSFMEGAEDHLPGLRSACRQLKFVNIKLYHSRRAAPTSLEATCTLLEAMLVSPGLQMVKLDLVDEDEPDVPVEADASVGPLLANVSWDELRGIHRAGFAIKVDELREVLGKPPGGIHLDLDAIFLLDGTWAEALEILRGRADSSSRVVNPRGVEIEALSQDEAKYLRCEFDSEHRESWYSAQRCPGPASFYIRGGNIPNPLIRVDD